MVVIKNKAELFFANSRAEKTAPMPNAMAAGSATTRLEPKGELNAISSFEMRSVAAMDAANARIANAQDIGKRIEFAMK